MSILKDYYYASDNLSSSSIYKENWQAQTFTTTESYKIKKIRLKMRRRSYSAIITISVQGTDINGKPDGVDLDYVSFDDSNLSVWPADAAWADIPLSGTVSLNINTKYAIVIRNSNSVYPPNNDTIHCIGYTPGGYLNGSLMWSSDSGVTWTVTADDLLFEIWSSGGIIRNTRRFRGLREKYS